METTPKGDWPELLVLVRHGESLRNRVKAKNIYLPDDESATILDGTPDHRVPLTEEGLRQAAATGPFLKQCFGMFDVAYHSGYKRTQDTLMAALQAGYAAEEIEAMKIRENHLIRERFPGYTYDMNTAQAEQYFPYLPKHWKDFGPFYGVPPGGESQETVCKTVYRFIGILRKRRARKKVLAVSHGGTIRAFRFCLEGWTADDYERNYSLNPPENCGVTVYRYSEDAGKLVLADYNKVHWQQSAVA